MRGYIHAQVPALGANVTSLNGDTAMHRKSVHKKSSARSFRKEVSRTHPKNISRGGYRL